MLLFFGVVPSTGGTFVLGIEVPWVSPKEGRAAHEPLQPAVIKSLETLMVFLFCICLPFGFVFGLVVRCRSSLVLEFCEIVLTIQNSTPVSIYLFVLFHFVMVVCVCVSAMFFSSLSGAGETQAL